MKKQTAIFLAFMMSVFSLAFTEEVDLIAQAQSANWENGDGTALRFGQDSQSLGTVLYDMNVILEDGKTYEKILFTHPQWKKSGAVRGIFPAISIPQEGGKLIVSGGFRQGADKSDGVIFGASFLNQRAVPGKRIRSAIASSISLGNFRAGYDGRIDRSEFDLGPAAGQTGSIILYVNAGNSADSDWAVWTEATLILGQPAAQKEDVNEPKRRLVQTLSGHTNRIYRALFSPDGRSIVTASGDGTAKIWNVSSGSLKETLSGHSSHVFCASFSPDSRSVVTAGGNTAIIWQASTGRRIQTLTGHKMQVHSAYFNRGGSRIVTASEDGTSKIWSAQNGTEQVSVQVVPSGWVYSAKFNPNGGSFATGAHNGNLGIYDAANGSQISVLKGHSRAINMVEYSPNGRYLMTASVDNTVRIWDLSRDREAGTLSGRQFNSAVFSADGKFIITGNDNGRASIWDAQTGKLVLSLNHGGNRVFCADISPDGKYAVTAGDNNSAKLWEINL